MEIIRIDESNINILPSESATINSLDPSQSIGITISWDSGNTWDSVIAWDYYFQDNTLVSGGNSLSIIANNNPEIDVIIPHTKSLLILLERQGILATDNNTPKSETLITSPKYMVNKSNIIAQGDLFNAHILFNAHVSFGTLRYGDAPKTKINEEKCQLITQLL